MNDYLMKIKRFKDATNHIEPDKVPVLGLFGTWVWDYGKLTAEIACKNVEKEMEAYQKVLLDFPVDGIYYVGEGRSMEMYDILGENAYFFSNDGTTIQHREITMMENSEYDFLEKDFLSYTFNTLFKRKYPNLNKGNTENYQALKSSVKEMLSEWDRCDKKMEIMLSSSIPITSGLFTFAPVDYLFDFYRGFKGISLDIRRCGAKVAACADVLADLIIKMFDAMDVPIEFPYCFSPLHLPPFINAKQFEKIYWPSFKKVFTYLFNRGVKVMFYNEGSWAHLFDFINELPKNSVICLLENDDILAAKKTIGKTVTIAGGLDTELLKFGTKAQCIDRAKKLIDICAPGGGFICSTNKILISGNDVNPENMQSVFEFINTYGIY